MIANELVVPTGTKSISKRAPGLIVPSGAIEKAQIARVEALKGSISNLPTCKNEEE